MSSRSRNSPAVDVRTQWLAAPGERVIEVQFWVPEDCFVVPEGTRVRLDGEDLALVSRGRVLTPESSVLGIRIPQPSCEPALFRSRPFTADTDGVGVIDVEMSGRTGRVEIDGLRAGRRAGLLSGDVLIPGHEAVLEWSPRSDVWPRVSAGAEVRIVPTGGARVAIAGSHLAVADGRFRFQVPALPAGPATVSVRAGQPPPTARIIRCDGFRECRSGDVGGPPPLSVRIADTGTPR